MISSFTHFCSTYANSKWVSFEMRHQISYRKSLISRARMINSCECVRKYFHYRGSYLLSSKARQEKSRCESENKIYYHYYIYRLGTIRNNFNVAFKLAIVANVKVFLFYPVFCPELINHSLFRNFAIIATAFRQTFLLPA